MPPRIPYPIEGLVTDVDGKPAVSVVVDIYNLKTDCKMTTTTGTDGTYILDLANGDKDYASGEPLFIRAYAGGNFFRYAERKRTINGGSLEVNMTLVAEYPEQPTLIDTKFLDRKEHDGVNNAKRVEGHTTIPEHKTYMLYGHTSEQVDDLVPAKGKRIRLYGFYGTYTVNAAFNPTVIGSISFGTGGLSDRSKVLGGAGELAGARTVMFTMTPLNRLGEVDEIIRFSMATYDNGEANAVFILLYNEE